MRNKSQLSAEEREAVRSRRAASLFDETMEKAAEPIWVFQCLATSCRRRKDNSIKYADSLSEDETEWLRNVLAEGEKALAEVKSLLEGGADSRARLIATLKLQNQHHRRQIGLE